MRPLLPNHFFVQGEADGLRDAAFDLAGGENWMEDFADFLQGDEIVDGYAIGREVNGDLRDVDGPGVCGVSVAAIFFVVPEDVGRAVRSGRRLRNWPCWAT